MIGALLAASAREKRRSHLLEIVGHPLLHHVEDLGVRLGRHFGKLAGGGTLKPSISSASCAFIAFVAASTSSVIGSSLGWRAVSCSTQSTHGWRSAVRVQR